MEAVREEQLEESYSTRDFRKEITSCRVVSSTWLGCYVKVVREESLEKSYKGC
ncbi:hypothetical protein AXF42_Ash015296 [Apostasia shenzhenica]|uniref:Uncharacterized protein n=1 Tax=Apostasia shenzhenica TaxID=1088818 RepID=A0A2I0ALU4_9ASPA|nr:hypothetical protein AXF42_Ash015296 [Apostasia shenzhenica]